MTAQEPFAFAFRGLIRGDMSPVSLKALQVCSCLLQVFLTTKTSCAHAPRQLVTGSVLSTAYYTSQHPTQPQLSSQAAAYATRQLAHLFAAARHSPFFIPAFFVSLLSRRAFSHPNTHTSKLTCATDLA